MEVGKTIKYRTYYFLFVSLIMLIMEIVMYLIIFQSMPRYFILDISTILLLALPIMIWYHKLGAYIYGSIVFTLHLAIFIGNLSLYHASSDFISISYLNVLKEAGTVFSWSFLSIWFILLAVFFLASYIFGLVMFVKKTPKGNNYLIKYGLYFTTIMLLILIPSKEITYNTIENNVLLTGNDYFEDHRSQLPIGSEMSEVTLSDLVNGKYMEPVKDVDGNPCDEGTVYAYRENNKYR